MGNRVCVHEEPDWEWDGGCCEKGCPCNEPEEMELEPCDPGSTTACSEFGASVQASLPVWYADRNPFPRGLVTMEEEFWTSDAYGNYSTSLPSVQVWGNQVDQEYWEEVPGDVRPCQCRVEGTCYDDPPPDGWVCSYQLGLMAVPAQDAVPMWNCAEAVSGGGTGWTTSCTWEYSSWGQPEEGFGLNCESLPAFAVTASAPYYWYFARQWDSWEDDAATGWMECGCSGEQGQLTNPGWRPCDEYEVMDTWEAGEHGNPPADTCYEAAGPNPTLYWGSYWGPIPGWVHHGPEWEWLDLRLYGLGTPYMLNPLVQLAPYRPCGPHPVGALYVPVIEVQSLID